MHSHSRKNLALAGTLLNIVVCLWWELVLFYYQTLSSPLTSLGVTDVRRLSVTDDRRLGVRNANVSTIFSEMVCMIAKVLFTHFSQVLWDCLNICRRKLFGRMK